MLISKIVLLKMTSLPRLTSWLTARKYIATKLQNMNANCYATENVHMTSQTAGPHTGYLYTQYCLTLGTCSLNFCAQKSNTIYIM